MTPWGFLALRGLCLCIVNGSFPLCAVLLSLACLVQRMQNTQTTALHVNTGVAQHSLHGTYHCINVTANPGLIGTGGLIFIYELVIFYFSISVGKIQRLLLLMIKLYYEAFHGDKALWSVLRRFVILFPPLVDVLVHCTN